MIIDNAAISMSSKHKHSVKSSISHRRDSVVIGNQDTRASNGKQKAEINGGFWGVLNYSADRSQKKESGLLAGITDQDGQNKYNSTSASTESAGVTGSSDPLENYRNTLKLQFETLNYLFMMLFRKRIPYSQENYLSDPVGDSMKITTDSTTYTYEEAEETSFSTTGCVRTADGREIEFGIEMSMSRSFYAEYSESFSRIEPNLLDPLVINLDGNVTGVSDQKFFFDLDGNGEEEEIYSLSSGNGFLALDKNQDGIINDGTELFGAVTGNGFSELAEYDLDGNGWIDEADDIYGHLKVWTKDEKGKDRLFTLKEAGVGAISLVAADTAFSIKDQNNTTKAKVRSSGFFLHENGVPGMIQQLDMAM